VISTRNAIAKERKYGMQLIISVCFRFRSTRTPNTLVSRGVAFVRTSMRTHSTLPSLDEARSSLCPLIALHVAPASRAEPGHLQQPSVLKRTSYSSTPSQATPFMVLPLIASPSNSSRTPRPNSAPSHYSPPNPWPLSGPPQPSSAAR